MHCLGDILIDQYQAVHTATLADVAGAEPGA